MGGGDRASLTAERIRLRAARVMRVERSARAVSPAVIVILAYLTLALFGWSGPVWFAVSVVIAFAALIFGLRRCHWPMPDEIDRRIETRSGLRHRPLATLDDQPESADPLAQAIWRAHRRRAGRAVAGARAGWPEPGGAAGDPWALRAILLLLLVAGVVIAGPAAPGRLAGAFRLPALPAFEPQIDVWVTPPDYAGAAPALLAVGQVVTALPGSRISVLVNGPRRLPALSLAGIALAGTDLGPASHRADGVLTHSGRLLIGPWWHRLGAWRITVVPPDVPRLRLAALGVTARGQLRLGWDAEDRYGLTSLSARIRPVAAPPDALAQDFALPANVGVGAATLDLSDDPLAGLPSRLILSARNLAGVSTRLAPAQIFTPPAPILTDPSAIALFGLRQALARDPARAGAVAAGLRRIAGAPPSAIPDGVDVQLAALAAALGQHLAGPAEAVRRLGRLIRQIEAGPDYLPARVLARADEALLSALRRGVKGAGLSVLLQAMHAALAQHLAALGAMPAAGAPVNLDALDRLARQIAADQAAGRAEQAAREMAALQSALNALQTARPQTPAQAARARAAAAAARDLAALVSGEAALRDDTDRGVATPEQQAALQTALGKARERLSQAGIRLPGLVAASGAMAGARQALGVPDAAAAEAQEAAAIQSLQKATAALNAAAQSLALGQGGGQGNGGGAGTLPEDEGGGANGAPDERPGGLTLPNSGAADAIQQQIIREDAAPGLPAPTHQYLHRLLDPGQP